MVSLDETLRAKGISSLLYKGRWKRITDRRLNGDGDMFIGAGVTEFGEATKSDIDLCAEIEALFGFVLGLNPQLETVPALGMWYNDYDHCFADNLWVRVGIPDIDAVFLVLSGTAKDISKGDKIKCVDGVWQRADTNDNFQMISKEDVTGVADTRKYFYARWVKN